MQAIPAIGEATLVDLQRAVEQRITGSVGNQRLDTRDARQLWFLKFLREHKISNVFAEDDIDSLLACFTLTLLDGNSIQGKKIRCKTIKNYLTAINDYFEANDEPKPVDFTAKKSKVIKLITAQEKFESMPARRLPLTPRMQYKIMIEKTIGADPLGLAALIGNVLGTGRYTGYRKGEIMQDKDDEVQIYITPDGQQIVRALVANSVAFLTEERVSIDISLQQNRDMIDISTVKYPIQKNRMNQQSLDYDRTREKPEYCFVNHMLQMIDRAHTLGQPDHLPLAVYRDDKDSKVKYLTGDKFQEYLRSIVLEIMPGISAEDLKLYSTHSVRVTACVNLHEAGKDGTYIKLRIRWKSDCFEIYLRNTAAIRFQHAQAMALSNEEIDRMRVTAPASVVGVNASAGAEDDVNDDDENVWNDLV